MDRYEEMDIQNPQLMEMPEADGYMDVNAYHFTIQDYESEAGIAEYDRIRRQKIFALWDVNRTEANRIMGRHQHPLNKQQRAIAIARGEEPPPRYFVHELEMDPDEIPPREEYPNYNNLEKENEVIKAQPLPTFIVDVSGIDQINRPGDVMYLAPEISEVNELVATQVALPNRQLVRIFNNQTNRFLFRRFVFGANLPFEHAQVDPWLYATHLADVIWELLYYCLYSISGRPNSQNLATWWRRSMNTFQAQFPQTHWSLLLHNSNNQTRYTGFHTGITYHDVLRRLSALVYDFYGEVRIELQLVQERQVGGDVFEEIPGYRLRHNAYVPEAENQGGNGRIREWAIVAKPRGVFRVAEEEEKKEPEVEEVFPARERRLQEMGMVRVHRNLRSNSVVVNGEVVPRAVQPGPTGPIYHTDDQGRRRSTRVRRTRVAGYNITEEENQPFLDLRENRQWEIQKLPPPAQGLSPHIRRKMNHFHRSCVYPVALPEVFIAKETGQVQVGAYEILERHTVSFYKRSVLDMYAKNGSVFYNPETVSYSCFLMSFLRAQCLEYTFDDSQNSLIAYEENCYSPSIQCTLPQWEGLEQDYSFVQYDLEKGNYYLSLFQTNITEHELLGELTPHEIATWELAARQLEVYISEMVGEWVDVNDLETIASTVSRIFHVIVQIYDIQTSDKRAWIFTPDDTKTIGAMAHQTDGKIRIISLLYDQGHMIPIRDIRRYLSVQLKHNLRKGAYCPICEKHGGKEMHTKKGVVEHISNCYRLYKHKYWSSVADSALQFTDYTFGVKPIKMKFNMEEHQMVPSCVYCSQMLLQKDFLHHRCFISPKEKPKEPKNASQFYVYDIEAAQIMIPDKGVSYHVCNMLVFRKMEPETEQEREGICFDDEYAFMNHLMANEEYENSVILAHNGGSYDHHFILRYLERMKIPHSFIPTPNSLHKFLSITIEEKNITFLDFIHFNPGSLKSICASMGLSVTKGDFPHKFNIKEDISYRGCIPPIDTEEDYWCLQTKKDKEDVRELLEFHAEQSLEYCTCEEAEFIDPQATHCNCCFKKLWIMKEVMYRYCKLDVDALAEAASKYRSQLMSFEDDLGNVLGLDVPWNPTNIEPFDFMTVPQLAMQILLQGFSQPIFRNAMDKRRMGQTSEGLLWVQEQERILGHKIYHRQNHHREYYDYELGMFMDGYCEETDQMFVCLDCNIYGCEDCHFHKIQTLENHPLFPMKTYSDVWLKTVELIEILRYRNCQVIFACKVNKENYTPYLHKCLESVSMSSFFYGGRTEVFQPLRKISEEETIEYHDVCSLYPYVCAFKPLPFDIPQYIPGYEVELYRLFHRDPKIKYWGYIRCKVIPNPHCLLGLLPRRTEEGRLTFSVEPMEGCWGLDEMELAVQQGYQIVEVYEVIHWSDTQRSDQLFRGYVDYFLKMKQESEGWVKLGGRENMTEEEKDALIERLFHSNGQIGRIQKEKVTKSPIRRALAKLFLNSLWGKFAQKPKSKKQGILYTPQDFIRLWCDPKIEKESLLFRETGVGIFKYQYDLKAAFTPENAKGNIFLAAKVTEHARCILHAQMIKIHPERILYCDTDSIIFVWSREKEDLTGIGLGKWTNEYPTKRITEFLALAPKFYMLVFEEEKTSLKVKGIQLTVPNAKQLTLQCLKQLMWDQLSPATGKRKSNVFVDHMTIYSNSHSNLGVQYGVMMTRYTKKIVQFVITKRKLVTDNIPSSMEELVSVRTVPIGYVEPI